MPPIEDLMKRLLPTLTIALTALLLAACAGTGPSANREIKTDSDQTDGDRRAAIRLELAQGYFSRGQFNTALDELKQALQAKPDMREAMNLRGLITIKDIFKRRQHPNANKDQHGRLRVAAAVGGTPDSTSRAKALLDAGCDVIVVDSAHGHIVAYNNGISSIIEFSCSRKS